MQKKPKWMTDLQELWPPTVAKALLALPMETMAAVDEVRMRCGRPLMISCGTGDVFVKSNGQTSKTPDGSLRMTQEEIKYLFQAACQHSVYAYEEEIRQGFLTLKGGYRLGLAGRITVKDGKVAALSHCAGACVRIMRELKGCADEAMRVARPQGSVYSTLIISPPMMGKTTLLRDMTRQISDGIFGVGGKRVCLVDERAELAGCVAGVPQLDVGLRTDVLDGCPKAAGMMMALRSLSPQVLVTDELGGEEDAKAVMEAAFAGVKVLATVHGKDENDLMQRQGMRLLIQERVFERYLVLGQAPGRIIKRLDQKLCPMASIR